MHRLCENIGPEWAVVFKGSIRNIQNISLWFIFNRFSDQNVFVAEPFFPGYPHRLGHTLA